MGEKSRGNWNIDFCIKSDKCLNNIYCDRCIRFSKFVTMSDTVQYSSNGVAKKVLVGHERE